MGQFTEYYHTRKINENLGILAYMLAYHNIDVESFAEWHINEGQHLAEGEYWNAFNQGFGNVGKASLAATAFGVGMGNPLVAGYGALGTAYGTGKGLYNMGKQWYQNNVANDPNKPQQPPVAQRLPNLPTAQRLPNRPVAQKATPEAKLKYTASQAMPVLQKLKADVGNNAQLGKMVNDLITALSNPPA